MDVTSPLVVTLAERLGIEPSAARVLVLAAAAIAAFFVVQTVLTRIQIHLRKARLGDGSTSRRRGRAAFAAGEFTEGARQVALAGDHVEARRMHEEAARMAVREGDPARAARHLEALGRHRDCGRLMLRAGMWRDAALAFERSGDLADAARAHEQGGRLVDAAVLFERCGRPEDALRCLTRAASSSAPADCLARRGEMALRAARLAQQLERHGQAGELLEVADLPMEAATEHEAAGVFERAAALYEDGSELERAAACWERVGRTKDALRCRAKAAVAAGNHELAARLFDEAGDTGGAADALAAAGSPREAALRYESLGNFSEAGWLHRRGGDLRSAAACFARAGEPFEAAGILLELGEDERALELLRQLPEADDRRLDADAMAGLALRRLGRNEEARTALEAALAAWENLGAAAPHLADYMVATAATCEALGDKVAALAWYRRGAALDPDRGDAREHVHRLAGRTSPGTETRVVSSTTAVLSAPERYEIVRELGVGGMGHVYLARDVRLDRLVALKMISVRWQDRQDLRERFVREARVSARLRHPNVVQVFDVGEHEGRPYMALEYVPGRDVRDLLHERGRLPAEEVVRIVRCVALALGAAHEQGIVHRDVKPDNVLLADDGTVKVLDFGIARVQDADMTHVGVVMGTPRFMSPEQALKRPVDGRSDLYALGGTAFMMLTGRAVFMDGDLGWKHVHEAPPDPRELAPDIPPALAELVLRCLAKDPARRPQSAADLVASLDAALTPAAVA